MQQRAARERAELPAPAVLKQVVMVRAELRGQAAQEQVAGAPVAPPGRAAQEQVAARVVEGASPEAPVGAAVAAEWRDAQVRPAAAAAAAAAAAGAGAQPSLRSQ